MTPLKIAMIAPLKRPLTVDTTVSRNRVIVDLALGLVRRGHKVSVFATLDSSLPGVEIYGKVKTGLNFLPHTENDYYRDISLLTSTIGMAVKMQDDFDIIHNHMYPEFLPILGTSHFHIPMVTTFHAQITPEAAEALSYFSNQNIVVISGSARKLADQPFTVIYNGIDTSLFNSIDNTERDYLLCVGRMSKAKDDKGSFLDPKGITNSIKAAQNAHESLKIVGNVEDMEFYNTLVKPHLNDKIRFVGEPSMEQKVSREDMARLFAKAKAFINPINWQEPFGLVMAEAMACGTPVIAYNRGSVPEIVKDGVTGFIINPSMEDFKYQTSNIKNQNENEHIIKKQGIEGLVEAINRIGEIDRAVCRKHVEENFSVEKMVENYENTYFKIINKLN